MIRRRLLRKALRFSAKMTKQALKIKNTDSLYPYELWAFQKYIKSIEDCTKILTDELK
jgi:hypothetical protein